MQGVHGFHSKEATSLVGQVLEDGFLALQATLHQTLSAETHELGKSDIHTALAAVEIVAALHQQDSQHLPHDNELREWVEDFGYVDIAPLPTQALDVLGRGFREDWHATCAVSKQARRRWLGKMQRLQRTLADVAYTNVEHADVEHANTERC